MKKLMLIPAAMMAMSLVAMTAVNAGGDGGDRADVVREFDEDGTAADDPEVIGWSNLVRRESGLKTTVHVEGLIPGGVYTFWWVVPHSVPPTIPDDVFVALGASAVVGANGKATVRMRADTGQAGITGFPPLEGALWHDLTDPLGAIVRVELAYHGQVEDAGDELPIWESNFWTGSACPPDTANPNPDQPHCPVYFAATHT